MRLPKLTDGAAVALLCWLPTVACSSDPAASSATAGSGGSGGSGAAAGAPASGGAPARDPDSVVGNFIVELKSATATLPGFTKLEGVVSDGPSVSNVVWDLVSRNTDCTLRKPRAPFCSVPCSGDDVCVEDDQCATSPTRKNVGIVTLTGLGSTDIAITTSEPVNIYQLPGDLSLPFPPAVEGADLELSVSQGVFGPFSIATHMIAPLVSAGTVTIERGKLLTLTWEAPKEPSLSRIQVTLDISNHGGTKGKIECDVADSGSIEIPASLISSLIDLGVGGFPVINLSRVASGSTVIAPGKVTLQTLSSVVRDLVVTGFQSCNVDSECDSGTCIQKTKTCQN